MPGHYVSVYFDQHDWQEHAADYTSDFRKANSYGACWNFMVASSMQNEIITLAFANLPSLPAGWQAILSDDKTGRSFRLENDFMYTITNNNEAVRHFTILVGTQEYISNESVDVTTVPQSFQLLQNFPNPFNPTTTIEFALPQRATVTLDVYNSLGAKVATLIDNQRMNAGVQNLTFDATNFSSGLYIYKLQAGAHVMMKKMMLLK
jgi:hypothetical protein